MKKSITSVWLVFFISMIYFSACQRKYACPAYHSAFILDENKTRSFFSQFSEDSLPKSNFYVNKNKTGIVVKMKFNKKQKEIHSLKMEMEFPPPVDSVAMVSHMEGFTGDNVDSLFALVTPQVSPKRDQDIYLRYMRQFHGWEDPRIIDEDVEEPIDPELEAKEEKKKKRWFWNRKKNDAVEEEPNEELKEEVEELF